jgi:hypothetical protein
MIIVLVFAAGAFSQSGSNVYGDNDSTYQPADTAGGYDYSDEDIYSDNSLDIGDFRNAYWGWSKDLVKSTEYAEPSSAAQDVATTQGANVLCYTGANLAGYKAYFEYEFDGDTLAKGYYAFNITNDADNDWFDDFDKIRQFIDAAYWPADYEELTWVKDTYKEDSTKWGYAIRIGDAEKIAQWFTDRTLISLEMYGLENKLYLSLYYDDDRAAYGNVSDSSGSGQ